MSNIYIGLSLSLFCSILAYIIVSKLILVIVFCVILACVYFKDDLTFLRYLAGYVSLMYLWCFELWINIQNMYHQSNSSNFPVRKCIENNGSSLPNKQDRLHHRMKANLTHNFNSLYNPICDTDRTTQSLSTKVNWSSGSNRATSTTPNHSYYPFEQNSSLIDVSPTNRPRPVEGYSMDLDSNFNCQVPMPRTPRQLSQARIEDTRTKYIESLNSSNNFPASDGFQSRNEDKPFMDAQLFANVNSPGFCSRIAERLSENMTHQQKYESVGAFPVVHLKSQSPKIKVKAPVRVRLAPSTSKDLIFTNIGANSISRPSLIGADESMKSVLQVLKEISRKRIHSHVDDDCDENSKRLRTCESQFSCDTGMHSSHLQQTFQGKRAREDSSPNEADAKKRKRSIQNNEISSSLSSSKSVKAPHLQPQKRKAHDLDDSYNSTPVLGKLLKVQTEVTPPALQICSSPPVSKVCAELKTSPLIVAPTTVSTPVENESISDPEPVATNSSEALETNYDDKVVSRLLGRMANRPEPTLAQETHLKKNLFMSTNDLSLSPPKENRLAAMIAVLGGPSNQHDIDSSDSLKQPDKEILSRDLFMSPGTPNTPKLNKKVTFNDSLTTTKVYDKDKSGIGEKHDTEHFSTASNSMPLSPKPLSETNSFHPSNEQFTLKPQTTAAASISFSSPSLVADTCEPVKQNEDSERVKSYHVSTIVSSSSLIETNLLPSQHKSTSLSDSTGDASNVSVAGIGNAKPFEFSFGATTSRAVNNKSIGDNTISVESTKTLSVDNSLKRPEAVLPSSAKSAFLTCDKNDKKEIPVTAKSVGESKNSFSLFPNKDDNKTGSSQSGNEIKPVVNGLAPTINVSSSPSFTFNTTATQASPNKPGASVFGTKLNSSPSVHPPPSPFISTNNTSNEAITSESISHKEYLPTNQPFTMFQNVSGVESHQSLFENKFKAPSNSSVFGPGSLNVGLHKAETTTQASQQLSFKGSGFEGSTTAQSNSTTATTAIQSNSLFGNISHNTTPQQSIFGAGGNSITHPSNETFGLHMASSTTPQASCSSFGTLSKNTVTSQSNNGLGSQLTPARSPGLFENILPSTNPQNSIYSQSFGQPSLSSGNANSNVSKPLFQSISNTTPTYVTTSNIPGSTGFAANSTNSFAYRNQANIASTFGSNTHLNFGLQANNNVNSGINGFPQPVEISGKGLPNTNVANSSASSLSSPFVFGSPSTNTEQAKPSAATKPFSFGSQPSSLTEANSSQLSATPFNSSNSGFGASLQPPAFSSVNSQPATTVFSFGQNSTPTQNFQFNAAGSQPVGGGMFNIGSGSSAPRSKTAANRRRPNK